MIVLANGWLGLLLKKDRLNSTTSGPPSDTEETLGSRNRAENFLFQ